MNWGYGCRSLLLLFYKIYKLRTSKLVHSFKNHLSLLPLEENA
jgi:hypothetical protein